MNKHSMLKYPLYLWLVSTKIRTMAKKGAREIVALICSVCKSQNYVTERNKVNMDKKGKGKLQIKKWCKFCKKVQLHKETAKLK